MTATDLISIEVPDIGDFENVPVIELHVSAGDSVAVDDPLLTLESDKATMDVPSPFAGIVRELHVSIGDHVSQGMLLLTIEPAGENPGNSKSSTIASQGVPSEAASPDAIGSALDAEPPVAAPAPASTAPAPPSLRPRPPPPGLRPRPPPPRGPTGRSTRAHPCAGQHASWASI